MKRKKKKREEEEEKKKKKRPSVSCFPPHVFWGTAITPFFVGCCLFCGFKYAKAKCPLFPRKKGERRREKKKGAFSRRACHTDRQTYSYVWLSMCLLFFFPTMHTISNISEISYYLHVSLPLSLLATSSILFFFFYSPQHKLSLSLSFFFFYVWSRSLTLLLDHFSHIFTIIAFFFFHFKAFFPLLRAYTSFCFFFFFYVVIKSTLF